MPICYRDRTFCKHSKDCIKARGCDIALNLNRIKDAQQLGLPIAVFTEPPECLEVRTWDDELQLAFNPK